MFDPGLRFTANYTSASRGSPLRYRVEKAIRRPHEVPRFLKGRLERELHTVEGSVIVWPAPGRALLKGFDLPRPGDHEIMILTHATLVSPGTERALFNGLPGARPTYPFTPGYSGAGEIVMVGQEVTRFKVGDRVAAPLPHASVMVRTEKEAWPVPECVTMEQASFLWIGIIALQGVRKAQIQMGESVAIIGQGLIGQIATQLVASAGAYPITAVASSGARLPMAERSGANSIINLSQGHDALDAVEADVVIDVTGHPSAFLTAVHCARPGGRVVLLGSNRGITHDVNFELVGNLDLTLLGAHIDSLPQLESFSAHWTALREGETFLQLIADSRLDVNKLITQRILPSEVERFYRSLSKGDKSIFGALFCWDQLPVTQRLNGRLRDKLARNRVYRMQTATAGDDRRPTRGGAPARKEQMTVKEAGEKLRVGLIGCGEIAVQSARGAHEAPNASLAIAMDVNEKVAKDMAECYNIPYTVDVEELLESDDVDAVLISVPHHLHAPLTIQAARQGKHIMVEKPIATNIEDADQMIAACRQAGVKLSVIYCQRYWSHVQKAKKLIDQGALGDILGSELAFQLDKPPSYWTGGYSGRVTTDWRLSKEKSGGGLLIFNIVHYLDMFRYLTGLEVTRVYGEYGTLDTPIETEDTLSVTLRYSNRAIGNIIASSCVRGSMSPAELRIWGTDGQMVLENSLHFYSLRQVNGHSSGQWHSLDAMSLSNDRAEFVTRFARAVLNDEEPEISGRDGRAIQAIVEAIYTSGELQKPVEVEQL
ncbi:MAG: bi-domain-containing oxidoreductase [Chloroflexota bacterium]|nr:bi-domain-containing oxidoreductase [Chloroflexota bacterium]